MVSHNALAYVVFTDVSLDNSEPAFSLFAFKPIFTQFAQYKQMNPSTPSSAKFWKLSPK